LRVVDLGGHGRELRASLGEIARRGSARPARGRDQRRHQARDDERRGWSEPEGGSGRRQRFIGTRLPALMSTPPRTRRFGSLRRMNPSGPTCTLADGSELPLVGLGVWQIPNGQECVDAVRWALELGYRHIDTAQAYGNEESVGRALRESGVPRDQ